MSNKILTHHTRGICSVSSVASRSGDASNDRKGFFFLAVIQLWVIPPTLSNARIRDKILHDITFDVFFCFFFKFPLLNSHWMTINLTEWLPYFLPHNTTSTTNSNTECTNSPSLTVSSFTSACDLEIHLCMKVAVLRWMMAWFNYTHPVYKKLHPYILITSVWIFFFYKHWRSCSL